MNIGEDYKFRDDLIKDPKATVPIELLTGPYKGVVYNYTEVAVKEMEDGTAKMQFSYDLHQMGEHTETSLRRDQMFTQHIGLVLNRLILETVDAEETVKEDE